MSADVLLVGSLPVPSADVAFRAGAELFGDLTFALPDGETGPRATWVPYDRDQLLRPNPGIELLQETESPTSIPRNVFETPKLRVRQGVTRLELGTWPRIDEAIASYAVFKRLRQQGFIPAGLRFQVCLPFPASITNATFKVNFEHDHQIVAPALEDLMTREIARLLDAIPAADLAIQWDVCYEVVDLEKVVPWTSGDAWERYAGPVRRLGRAVPQDVLMGYHLCYGTAYGWPMYEARDMGSIRPSANRRSFEGVWQNSRFETGPLRTVEGEPLPYNVRAQNKVWHTLSMKNAGTPVLETNVACLPSGLMRDLVVSFPMQFAHTDDHVIMMQSEGRGLHVIRLNSKHPPT